MGHPEHEHCISGAGIVINARAARRSCRCNSSHRNVHPLVVYDECIAKVGHEIFHSQVGTTLYILGKEENEIQLKRVSDIPQPGTLSGKNKTSET